MPDRLDALAIDQLRAILEVRHQFAGESTVETFGLDLPIAAADDPNASSPSAGIDPHDPLPETSSEEIFDEIRLRQKAVYGDDDRIEVLAATNPEQQRVAKSVAAVIPAGDFMAIDDTRTSISPTSLADKYAIAGKPLCSREPFRSQPASAIGTAFLIGPSTVATAHHCINEGNFSQVHLVFDFELDANEEAPTQFDLSQVYAVKEFVAGAFTVDAADWAIVELDREVSGRLPLPFRREGKAPDDAPVYVVGHPLGLPKKIAGNAQIRLNEHDDFFVANLDTYGGNSGSPVLNAITHEVEGILVRGQTDFAPLGNCFASLVCPVGGCRGEDCSRTAVLADHH